MRNLSVYLSNALYLVGKSVGTHPKSYVMVSLTVGLLLSTGIPQGRIEDDIVELYFDFKSESGLAWEFADRHFPVNYSAFLPDRVPTFTPKAEIIFEPQASDSVLSKEILLEVAYIEHKVKNFTFTFMDRNYTYADVCAQWNGKCYETATTKMLKMIDEVKKPGGSELDWPIFLSPDDFDFIVLPESLGSPTIDEKDSIVVSAKAIKSTFYLRDDGEFSRNLARAWQKEFEKRITELKRRLQHTVAVHDESRRVHEVFSNLPFKLIKEKLWISISALTVFSVLALMTTNWVTAKPMLGLVGVMSSGLATTASFGLLLACGVPFNALVAAVPFLTLGVGMDDAFVLVAAWRKTDRSLPIAEQMGLAYTEAAVSITITTLTDVLSFVVGMFIPMRAVSEFCLFSALAMAATYVCVIFFFGGFLAIYGRIEMEGRHCLTLKKISPDKSEETATKTIDATMNTESLQRRREVENGAMQLQKVSTMKGSHNENNSHLNRTTHSNPGEKNIIMASMMSQQAMKGGGNKIPINTGVGRNTSSVHQEDDESDNEESVGGSCVSDVTQRRHGQSSFDAKLRRGYVELLHSWFFRLVVLGTFAAYIAGAVIGILGLETQNSWKSLVPRDDPYGEYADKLELHYLDYPQPVQLMLAGNISYSNTTVQDRIEQMLKGLENSEHFRGALYTQSWLRGFLTFLETSSDFIRFDASDEESFNRVLRSYYLEGGDGGNINALDVDFGDDGKIRASRFILQPTPMRRGDDIHKLMAFVREYFAGNFTEFEVHHLNSYYVAFGENSLRVPYYTVSTLAAAVVVMFIVTILLIPNFLCSVYISTSICTITAGLAGYGELFGQELNNAVMVSLIMCVGFSVDYSAHIAFAYIHAKQHSRTTRGKLNHAMEVIGWPVVLGAVTTFIGISGLINAPSEGFNIFFTILTGVIVLGVYHGLVVLPVLLITTDDVISLCCGARSSASSGNSSQLGSYRDEHGVVDTMNSRKQKATAVIAQKLEPGIYYITPPMVSPPMGAMTQPPPPPAIHGAPLRLRPSVGGSRHFGIPDDANLQIFSKLREELQQARVFLPRLPPHPAMQAADSPPMMPVRATASMAATDSLAASSRKFENRSTRKNHSVRRDYAISSQHS